MRLPTISGYYPYRSSNYGANSLRVSFENLDLYYSYETIVAFSTLQTGLVCRENDWSSTTGKHLNQIQPDKSKRITGVEFEKQLEAVLIKFGLSRQEERQDE